MAGLRRGSSKESRCQWSHVTRELAVVQIRRKTGVACVCTRGSTCGVYADDEEEEDYCYGSGLNGRMLEGEIVSMSAEEKVVKVSYV